MKNWLRRIPALLIVMSIVVMAVLSSCTAKTSGEGFAIYLMKNDVPPAILPSLNYIGLADTPLISGDDIISYNAGTYEIKLTDTAFNRLSELQVPTTGKSFVVCVEGQIMYTGAFWTPISSQSFDGITIMKPLGSQDTVIQIGLGYPGPSSFNSYDQRSNPRIIDSLEKAGKLIR